MFDDIKQIDGFFHEAFTTDKLYYSATLRKNITVFEYAMSLKKTVPIFLLGDVGSGKSVFAQLLNNKVKETHKTFFISRPFVHKEEYLAYICQLFDVKYTPSINEITLLAMIEQKSIEPTVLLIDAFELMSYEQMQLTFKLHAISSLTIVCAIRSAEAEKHFNNKKLMLEEKVSLNCSPLTVEEIGEYIHFILEYSHESAYRKLFTQSVLLDVKHYTKGNWRALNKFLHALFKTLAYSVYMGKPIEKITCVMLAKIAYEQNIIGIKGFKKRCFSYHASKILTFFISFVEVALIIAFIAFMAFSHRLELNATAFLSQDFPMQEGETWCALDNESVYKTVPSVLHSDSHTLGGTRYDTIFLHVKFSH